jgi:nucleoid DNA-binding protein
MTTSVKTVEKKVPSTKLVKKAKPVKKTAKKKVEQKPMSKGQLYTYISQNTGIDKKAVAVVLDELTSAIYSAVAPGGVGKFTLPGVLKIALKATPPKPEREGKNPFTGEVMTFKAKPASVKVKILPLKSLKDTATS